MNENQEITLTDMEIATIHDAILQNTKPSEDCKSVAYRITKSENQIIINDSNGQIATISLK